MTPDSFSSRLKLPSLEFDCMKVIWILGQGTVKQVHQNLASHKSLAYTTVLTVLDRLYKKGVVRRKKNGRAHLYRPVYLEEDARKDALGNLMKVFFGGSKHQLTSYIKRLDTRTIPSDD